MNFSTDAEVHKKISSLLEELEDSQKLVYVHHENQELFINPELFSIQQKQLAADTCETLEIQRSQSDNQRSLTKTVNEDPLYHQIPTSCGALVETDLNILPTSDISKQTDVPDTHSMSTNQDNIKAEAENIGSGRVRKPRIPRKPREKNVSKKVRVKRHTLLTRPVSLPIVEETDAEEKSFICSVPGCDWKFRRKSDMLRHLRSHEKPVFHCPYAVMTNEWHKGAESFYRMDVFNRHMRHVHFKEDLATEETKSSIRPGHCKVCKKRFEQFRPFLEHTFECALTDRDPGEIDRMAPFKGKIDLRLDNLYEDDENLSSKLTPIDEVIRTLEKEARELKKKSYLGPDLSLQTSIRLVKNTQQRLKSSFTPEKY